MSSDKDLPKGKDYQSIIDEGIDDLNADSNFEDTDFRQEQSEKAPVSKRSKNLLLTLGLLVILNLGAMLYLRSKAPEVLNAKRADLVLYEKLASEDIEVSDVLNFVSTPDGDIPLPEGLEASATGISIPTKFDALEEVQGARFYEAQSKTK